MSESKVNHNAGRKKNGFEKPNHTQTPNSFFDEIIKEIDTMAELKVTLAIIRQTIGWHRKRVKYGVGKIERLTGLARNSVIAGAEAAEARGTIHRIETEGEAEWELVIDDTPSTAEGSDFEGSENEADPPQTLTEKPSTAEGLKRKKEIKENIGGLSEKELAQANAKVTAMVENAKKVKYDNRDKIPEPYLALCDTYVELTKQTPTKRVLMDWLSAFSDWISEGLQPKDIRAAYQHANRPEGGFLVGRPGSLTNTAVALKSKVQATSPQIDETAVEETRQMVEQKTAGTFIPRPSSVPPPSIVQSKLQELSQQKGIRR